MEVFWFWLIVVLVLVAILAWPTWPYTRSRWPYTAGYDYALSAAAVFLVFFLLLLFWLGALAVWWPWAATY